MPFTEKEILTQLNLAFKNIPDEYFPSGQPQDIRYNFFLDLEHGYCDTAGNRVHLYADINRWSIVFEKSGYQNRAGRIEIELSYVGNCIDYPVNKYPERNYITNTNNIVLIDQEELIRIENKLGEEMETFELIGQDITSIKVRDTFVPFNNDYRNYENIGIKIRDYDNPKNLIGFSDYLRYLHATNPGIISATEEEIHQHIPVDLPKLMTIDEFHFNSAYDSNNLPSNQETYQLFAKILVTRKQEYWLPTLAPNNHWSNWESGNL